MGHECGRPWSIETVRFVRTQPRRQIQPRFGQAARPLLKPRPIPQTRSVWIRMGDLLEDSHYRQRGATRLRSQAIRFGALVSPIFFTPALLLPRRVRAED